MSAEISRGDAPCLHSPDTAVLVCDGGKGSLFALSGPHDFFVSPSGNARTDVLAFVPVPHLTPYGLAPEQVRGLISPPETGMRIGC